MSDHVCFAVVSSTSLASTRANDSGSGATEPRTALRQMEWSPPCLFTLFVSGHGRPHGCAPAGSCWLSARAAGRAGGPVGGGGEGGRRGQHGTGWSALPTLGVIITGDGRSADQCPSPAGIGAPGHRPRLSPRPCPTRPAALHHTPIGRPQRI